MFCEQGRLLNCQGVAEALVKMRCEQLELDAAEHTTTFSRAVNFRRVCELEQGFVGNATTSAFSQANAATIMACDPSEIALMLRRDLTRTATPDCIAARNAWYNSKHEGEGEGEEEGGRTAMKFDPSAMTFILSSWRKLTTTPGDVCFGTAAPLRFMHAAHVPIVAVMVDSLSRPDHLEIFMSGPRALEMLLESLKV